ncbi:DUF1569 domain-containing protein [Mucilaginibacter rigui]|uniref:DUF1569 domain-containing protein n=1 Tax=Mucilaginibacter rigui TaxID=534635 RepID=A0ABR7X636_9SPHI|nr:DUF1569 domain-containing protein [Mucilaginibacter rigui]MBD1386047.1 DUF1569 domain-containing protein [Mucilaginibacter rigui]
MKQLAYPANRETLHHLLLKLQPDAIPVWGKMTAQQMVEHMIEQVRYSYEKLTFVFNFPEDEANQAKKKWIYTDAQIPPNLILGPLPTANEYPDLHAAIKQLMLELEDFDRYFEQADTVVNHGAYGPMDYNEWLIWHGKHLAHHLRQFGLIN